jgi:hypothetical protein
VETFILQDDFLNFHKDFEKFQEDLEKIEENLENFIRIQDSVNPTLFNSLKFHKNIVKLHQNSTNFPTKNHNKTLKTPQILSKSLQLPTQ